MSTPKASFKYPVRCWCALGEHYHTMMMESPLPSHMKAWPKRCKDCERDKMDLTDQGEGYTKTKKAGRKARGY